MSRLLSLILLLFASVAISAQQRADSLLMRFVHSEGLDLYTANDIEIFTNGSSTFDALFADIDRAQHKVWVEFMIVANDSIGNLLIDHLAQAADRGCEVRLIIDDYKDWERSYGFRTRRGQASIRNRGIDLVLFDPFRFPWVNHVCRDHRKIVVIDDHIGYIGGLNVADYYVNGDPKYRDWRDTHLRLTGRANEGLAVLFDQHYRRNGGEGEFSFNYDAPYNIVSSDTPSQPKVVYFERSRTSGKLKSQTRRAFIAAFDAARDTLRFVTPYMLPTYTVRQAILRALRRGVYVELMFSRYGDNPMLSYGNFNFAQTLYKHGAHIYLYRGAFHHSKIIMVDGQLSMVGSANLNSRSLKWDYEASSFIFSHDITHRLDSIFRTDTQSSDIFTPSYYRREFNVARRTAGWCIDRFLTPIL